MKRIVVVALSIIAGMPAFVRANVPLPDMESATFYTKNSDGYSGNLMQLASAGMPPYEFFNERAFDIINGTLTIARNGDFTFRLSNPKESGSFKISVVDGSGLASKPATITILYRGGSLRDISLHAVAAQVKAGKYTLEQAKKVLPTDLHEELEKEVKRP